MKSTRNLDDYVTVAERLERFWQECPNGRIYTVIIEHDREQGFVLVRAEVYRDKADVEPAATGHAYEIRSEGPVNRTSYIENGETSAVGRALAMLGYCVKSGIASREEMQKAVADPRQRRQAIVAEIEALGRQLGYDRRRLDAMVDTRFQTTGGLDALDFNYLQRVLDGLVKQLESKST